MRAAGVLRHGILTLRLEIRRGNWYPGPEPGPSLPVEAFAEEGQEAQIPGPLLRVPQGTKIHVTVRNRLEKAVQVFGLHERPGTAGPLAVPPGESREARFGVAAPGTYYYWASSTGQPLATRVESDSQLSGALVVDPPEGAAPDRVFVIGRWDELTTTGDPTSLPLRVVLVVNGKSWPHTERLTTAVGETVRWRWINTSARRHPMHLHGSHFSVESRGDGACDERLAEDQRALVVTENMPIGGTMSLSWVPPRAGRWLFHCHVVAHMAPERRIDFAPGNAATHEHRVDESGGMGGLVIGVEVHPRGGTAAPAATVPVEQAGPPRRRLRLLVREQPAGEGSARRRVFQLQAGPEEPAIESATVPGPPLVLVRGEPVEIEVENRLPQPTAVHWHGIELESYYDGVPGWGGFGGLVAPAITPGGSFAARMAPPRAGTFIYHTHWHDLVQLTSGLYGALIVLEPGATLDPETDRVLLISQDGLDLLAPVLLNGSAQPTSLRLRAATRYRLRLINITPNSAGLTVTLRRGAAPVTWRALAKDGADLPPAQQTERPASQVVGVGETFDFEFQTAQPEELELVVRVPRPLGRMTHILTTVAVQ